MPSMLIWFAHILILKPYKVWQLNLYKWRLPKWSTVWIEVISSAAIGPFLFICISIPIHKSLGLRNQNNSKPFFNITVESIHQNQSEFLELKEVWPWIRHYRVVDLRCLAVPWIYWEGVESFLFFWFLMFLPKKKELNWGFFPIYKDLNNNKRW